jgi:hypothetical protein
MWVIFASLEEVKAANAISTELDIGRGTVRFASLFRRKRISLQLAPK